MTIEATIPFFILTAFALAFIALPAFRFTDVAADINVRPAARFAPLDGLRGFLAFFVFIFHIVTTHTYLVTGIWLIPQQWFYALLGPIGVSLFFMTTGFLFWNKLLTCSGRMAWVAFYRHRFFRIVPMYLVAVVSMLIIVAFKTGFSLREPVWAVVLEVAQWLALGIVNLQPDVNGYPASHVLASVTWTISYEWAFYAALFLSAFLARRSGHSFYVIGALVLALTGKIIFDINACGFAALFLCGMTVASLLHENKRLSFSDRHASCLALLSLTPIFALPALGFSLSGYGTIATLALAAFFYFVCSGASLFGLLLTKPARRLGNISYSLYLLQGLALVLVFSIPLLRSFALSDAPNYWLAALLCSCLLIAVASLTYFFVELPSIRFGKRSGVPSPRFARPSNAVSPVPFIVTTVPAIPDGRGARDLTRSGRQTEAEKKIES